jgi:hypothetical protein
VYRVLPIAAVLSVALIAGCGGGDSDKDGSSAAAGDDRSATEQDASAGNRELEIERGIADCMKKQGFQYIPRPMSTPEEGGDSPRSTYGDPRSILQPDAKVRAWRQKYGFGGIAELVYPNDPQVASRLVKQAKNPNDAIVDALDPARRRAYTRALLGSPDQRSLEIKSGIKPSKEQLQQVKDYEASCTGKLRSPKSAEAGAPVSAEKKEAARRLMAKFTNDRAVIEAADKFGVCMKERGYQIGSISTDPWLLAGAANQLDTSYQRATKSTSAARQELVKDRKRAVADVDCRAPYAKIVQTEYPTILDAADLQSSAG